MSYGNTPADYVTDVMAGQVVSHLNMVLQGNSPFYMMISPVAPHASVGTKDPIPAPRHDNLFGGLKAPRSASFNQEDVSKKAWAVRQSPQLLPADIEWIDSNFRLRIQSLQSLDEMIGKLIDQLQQHPRGKETYIIFTSDNGFYFGDHRIFSGKGALYDQAHHVPFAISGPNVGHGFVRDDLVTNLDFFPTILGLAKVSVPANSYDGRSLQPLIESPERKASFFRKSFLLESEINERSGIRLKSYTYLEYPGSTGLPFRELFDTQLDPGLRFNIVDRLTSASSALLADALEQLQNCSGDSCRQLENQITDALVEFVVQ